MLYFTADLHFSHEKILSLCHRPFCKIDEMDQQLVENWNRTVCPQDDVYILGDFTLKGPDTASAFLARLNGQKHLVCGNHDHFVNHTRFDPSGFVSIGEYVTLQYAGMEWVLFHYPILEWDGFYQGSIHLHGHQHNRMGYNLQNRAQGLRRYDVGVDANHFCPVSANGILAFFGLDIQPAT